jgi:hypothetical protein
LNQIRKRLTYANVMSSIAVFLVLGGAAFAAVKLPKNSVGTKQLKNNAVISSKVKDGSLTGADLNASTLGTVPSATNAGHAATADKATSADKATNADQATNSVNAVNATQAQNANTVGGHIASCPGGTTLIRGLCFDSTPNSAASSVFEASDSCRERGGWLPTPMELRSTRDVLDLGTGTGTDSRYTDAIYANDAATSYSTVLIEDVGGFEAKSTLTSARYFCVYPLVR